MATWGDFIGEVQVIQMTKPTRMLVNVDQVITIWEERNKLREEVAQLRQDHAQERENCAREVEEFAEACEAESDDVAMGATLLRAAAGMLRERGAPVAEEIPEEEAVLEGEEIPIAEPIEGEAAAEAGRVE